MPLYSIDDERPKEPILKSEHWKLFRRFQGSSLHTAFIAEIEPLLDKEQAIDSSWAGSAILGKLETQSPALYQSFPYEQLGGLFGMTLWNLLAQHPDKWRFIGKADDFGEPSGTRYFRQ